MVSFTYFFKLMFAKQIRNYSAVIAKDNQLCKLHPFNGQFNCVICWIWESLRLILFHTNSSLITLYHHLRSFACPCPRPERKWHWRSLPSPTDRHQLHTWPFHPVSVSVIKVASQFTQHQMMCLYYNHPQAQLCPVSVCPCINYLSLHSSLNIAFQIVHVAGRSLPCNLIQSLIALFFPPLPHRRTRLRYYGRTANEIRCMAISGDTDHIIGAFAHCT